MHVFDAAQNVVPAAHPHVPPGAEHFVCGAVAQSPSVQHEPFGTQVFEVGQKNVPAPHSQAPPGPAQVVFGPVVQSALVQHVPLAMHAPVAAQNVVEPVQPASASATPASFTLPSPTAPSFTLPSPAPASPPAHGAQGPPQSTAVS